MFVWLSVVGPHSGLHAEAGGGLSTTATSGNSKMRVADGQRASTVGAAFVFTNNCSVGIFANRRKRILGTSAKRKQSVNKDFQEGIS